MIRHSPFFFIFIFFLIGIITAMHDAISVSFATSLWLIAFGCLLIKHRLCKLCAIGLLIAATGFAYTQSRIELHRNHVFYDEYYYNIERLRGVLVSDVEHKTFNGAPKTAFTINVTDIKLPWGWREQTGKVRVQVFRKLDIFYGDTLEIEGKLHKPYNFGQDENFSYPKYLRNYYIHLMFSSKKNAEVKTLASSGGNPVHREALKLRKKLINILKEYLTSNELGLMQAMLLGDRNQVPKPIRELFVRTGTAHILAISGLHVGIVAGLLWLGLRLLPINRRWQILLTIFLLVVYAFLTGLRPSIMRALIMAVIFLFGYCVEREPISFNNLSFAACGILLVNPLYLFDVGFQLSFTCMVSIVLANHFTKIWQEKRKRKLGGFVRFMIISIAVWLGASGVSTYYFNIIVPITVLANMIVVPLISVVVGLGFGVLIFGGWSSFIAFAFATCLKIVLNIMVGVMFLLAQIPNAYVFVENVSIWYVIGYYTTLTVVITAWLMVGFRKEHQSPFVDKESQLC